MKKMHFGTDKYAIMVEIRGKKGEKKITKYDIIKGKKNSILTARVCSLTVQKLEGMFVAGIRLGMIMAINEPL